MINQADDKNGHTDNAIGSDADNVRYDQGEFCIFGELFGQLNFLSEP